MSFVLERSDFETELEGYYGTFPTDVADIRDGIERESAGHPGWSPFRRKALVYDTLADRCSVKVFRHFPFYFEINTGKARTDLGAGGLGAWLKTQPFGQKLIDDGIAWWQSCAEHGLSCGWPVLDDNHHCMGMDNVFKYGLNGLRQRAIARLKTARTDDEREFLEAMSIGLSAQMRLSERFASEAERLLEDERNPDVRRRLERIAVSARNVPANPPGTFYEALNTILFMRETTQSLEGNGISILGHLDRLLDPFYRRDIEEGRITCEEAKDLIWFLLAFSDVHFGMRVARGHVGTNTTVMIGGCDREGRPVFNDITRMISEAYTELKLVDPKLNARISAGHPDEYFGVLAGLLAKGCNSLCVFNDDTIITANVKMGKAVEDCRIYGGGGCQENVLEDTEVNSRATMYLNLLHVFLMGFFPEKSAFFTEREGIPVALYEGCGSYDALYAAFLKNLREVVDRHVARRNVSEGEGVRYNPCPLHSAMMDDCIEKARDMMAGGARYNFGSVSFAGAGTLVDSLFAVDRVVFREKRVSLSRLRDILAADFAGEEKLRQYLVNHVPKYGQHDESVRTFAGKVFDDLAHVTDGIKNSRGGRYEASLFSFTTYVPLGASTGATPDGRKAGEYLSQGMSPSVLSMGQGSSVGQVFDAIAAVDLQKYPVVAVLDVKLPLSPTGLKPIVFESVVRRFLTAGGSVLQTNCVNHADLLDAKKHPERHQDLVVRVSGYSAYFCNLSEALQDELIGRALLTAG